MNLKIEKYCIVFDLDGVLLDSWGLMQKAFSFALAKCQNPGSALIEDFRSQLGKPLNEICEILGLPDKFSHYYEKFSRENMDQAELFEGVPQVLNDLRKKNFILALNTAKFRVRTEEILIKFGIYDHFDVIITGDQVKKGKPSPDSLQIIADSLNIDCSKTFFVGDMPVDILCARAAGVTSVAALWGIGTEDELSIAAADLTARSIFDLLHIFKQL